MMGVVVAAHGPLAEALVHTAQLVLQHSGRVLAVSIDDADDTSSFASRLRTAVQDLYSDEGVLVLTDMFGGTPSNVGMTLHQPGHVEVLTGANLPMLIKALQLSSRGLDLAAAAREVKESGARAIAVASDVLSGGATQGAPVRAAEKSA